MKIEELEDLLSITTPGPWKWDAGNMNIESEHVDHDRAVICEFMDNHTRSLRYRDLPGMQTDYASDAELIASLRNEIPKYIAVARAACRVIASSKNDHFDDCLCKECLDYTDELKQALKELEK